MLLDTPLTALQTPSNRLTTLVIYKGFTSDLLGFTSYSEGVAQACGNARCLRPCGGRELQASFALGECPREQVTSSLALIYNNIIACKPLREITSNPLENN